MFGRGGDVPLRFIRAVLLPLAFSICASPCAAQTEKPSGSPPPPPAAEYNPKVWKEFSSPEGGFSVSLPGTPRAQTQEVDSPPGTVSFRSYVLQTGTGVYDVSYSDLPIYSEDPAHIRKGLDANRKALLKREGLKLLSEKEITFDGRPAREWLLLRGDEVVRRRLILVKERLYTLSLTTPLGVAFETGRPGAGPDDRTDFYEETSKKFFDSFRVTRRAAAATARTVQEAEAAGAPKALPESASNDAPAGAEPEGEADRMLKQLQERNELVIGVCGDDPDCKPIEQGQAVNGQVVRREFVGGGIVGRQPPEYPPIAKAARAQGAVVVHIIVDGEGKVIAAQALSGHPLLQAAAVKAVRGWTFSPPRLDGRPVHLTGTVTVNFKLQ